MFRTAISRRLSKKRSQEDESSELRKRPASKRLAGPKLHYYHVANLVRIHPLDLAIDSRLVVANELL